MSHTFEELKHTRVADLREIAKDVDHDALRGYSTMHKEELVQALCTALGIEAHVHHEVVGIDKAAVERKENIAYLRDPQMGYDAVDGGEADFLLVMNPTRMEQVRACTSVGEKMPQKSTDFYPKIITGLAMLPVQASETL